MTRKEAFQKLKLFFSDEWVVMRWSTRFGRVAWTVEPRCQADKLIADFGDAEASVCRASEGNNTTRSTQ